jgi:transcriptional antiterminator NusG
MKPEEIKKMRLEDVVCTGEYAVGNTVSVVDGPLKGFIGTIKEINASAKKAKIVTSMFGRNTEVEVDYIQIEKVEAEIPEQTGEDA